MAAAGGLSVLRAMLRGEVAYLFRWGDSPTADEPRPEWREKIFHVTEMATRADRL
jgi:hypothetical protein